MLDSFRSFCALYEIFHEDGSSLGEEFRALRLLGRRGTTFGSDQQFISWLRANPDHVIDWLVSRLGPRSHLAFKLFPGHIQNPILLAALFKREDIGFVLLKRRPIDCYISLGKARRTGQWNDVDTSNETIEADVDTFVAMCRNWGDWYRYCRHQITINRRPCLELSYEIDICQSDELLASSLKSQLGALGFDVDEQIDDYAGLKPTIQDGERDYRRKVSNWSEFSAELMARDLTRIAFSTDGFEAGLSRGAEVVREPQARLATRPNLDLRFFGFEPTDRMAVRALGVVTTPRHPLSDQTVQQIAEHIILGNLGSAEDGPLVSCLMVTRHRFDQARLAIRCFQRQTWLRRELVVIDTSEEDDLAAWVKAQDDPTIRLIHMPGCMDRLGDLRNRSVECARGDYVAQWDDDDLSHPFRLQAQMAVMSITGAEASMLLRELVWIPDLERLAVARARTHENTLVCQKAIMPRYPSLAKLEDTPLVDAILEANAVALPDIPELYVYVAHGANTWDDEHMMGIWRSAARQFKSQQYRQLLTLLAGCYPILEYHEALERRRLAKQSA